MEPAQSVPSIETMRAAAAEATSTLFALAHETRLLLLCQLCKGEKSVGELEATLDIHQPTLSQQLGVLRSDGLVETRREGKRVYYTVKDPKVIVLLNTLFELYCGGGAENP